MLPARLRIHKNESYGFRYNIFDEYYNPLPDANKYFFCHPALGKVDREGNFTAGNNAASGYIYLNVDGKKDSSYVIVE